jgi:thymidylate kinase
MTKGKLIVIDGNDGSGKHTQSEMLRSYFVALGKKVLPLSFPRYNDTFFGRELRKALDGKYGDFTSLDPHLAALLYVADRWASKPLMKQMISQGGYVICDRYVSANQIHQGGKILDVSQREDFLAWLDQLEFGEYGLPRPDASIYLDVPPEVSERLMSDKTRDIVENNPQYLVNSHMSAQWLIGKRPDEWIHVRCVSESGELRERKDIHMEIVFRLANRLGFKGSPRKG